MSKPEFDRLTPEAKTSLGRMTPEELESIASDLSGISRQRMLDRLIYGTSVVELSGGHARRVDPREVVRPEMVQELLKEPDKSELSIMGLEALHAMLEKMRPQRKLETAKDYFEAGKFEVVEARAEIEGRRVVVIKGTQTGCSQAAIEALEAALAAGNKVVFLMPPSEPSYNWPSQAAIDSLVTPGRPGPFALGAFSDPDMLQAVQSDHARIQRSTEWIQEYIDDSVQRAPKAAIRSGKRPRKGRNGPWKRLRRR